MKKLNLILLALLVSGCATGKPWSYNQAAIERHAMEKLQIYPAELEYDLCVVADQQAVSDKHVEIYGKPTQVLGFYSAHRQLVVVYENCPLRVLRHEIGHAVCNAYFKQPVPRWLHEFLARKCEED